MTKGGTVLFSEIYQKGNIDRKKHYIGVSTGVENMVEALQNLMRELETIHRRSRGA